MYPTTTATDSKDFTGLPNVITFLSGDFNGTESCINITIVDDNLAEGVEDFMVKLSSGFPGVVVSRAVSQIEITDNDGGMYQLTTFSKI